MRFRKYKPNRMTFDFKKININQSK